MSKVFPIGDLTESETKASRTENAPLSMFIRPADIYARETFSLWLIQVGDKDGMAGHPVLSRW